MKSSSRALKTSFLMMTSRFEKGSDDIYLVQKLLVHRNISTTQKHLGVNYAESIIIKQRYVSELLNSATKIFKQPYEMTPAPLRKTIFVK